MEQVRGWGLGSWTVLPRGCSRSRASARVLACGPDTPARFLLQGTPCGWGPTCSTQGPSTLTLQRALLLSSQTWAAADFTFPYFIYNQKHQLPPAQGPHQALYGGGGGRRKSSPPQLVPPSTRGSPCCSLCTVATAQGPFSQAALPGLGAPRGHSPWGLAASLEYGWAQAQVPAALWTTILHPQARLPRASPLPQSTSGPPQVSTLSQEAPPRRRDEIV